MNRQITILVCYALQLTLLLTHAGTATTFVLPPGSHQRRVSTAFRSAALVEAEVWTRGQLMDFADRQGVNLTLSTLGPGYRVVARSKQNNTQILGYIEGFVRPTGNLLHVDSMEVFNPVVKQVRQDNPSFNGGGTILGVGLLMGYLCMLHGSEADCIDAEFLAIDDEDFQHKRLVRYYKNAGFKYIKYVGDDIWDVPDRMVWGGCGTLLRAEITDLLRFWTSLMKRSDEKQRK